MPKDTEPTGPTGLALQLAKVDMATWRHAVNYLHYKSAPPTTPSGNQRKWNTNNVVCLRYFGVLLETGTPVPAAGLLARQLEIGLTEAPDAKELGVYSIPRPKKQAELRIRAEAPEGGELLMTLPVGDWRRVIRRELIDTWRAKQAAKRRT